MKAMRLSVLLLCVGSLSALRVTPRPTIVRAHGGFASVGTAAAAAVIASAPQRAAAEIDWWYELNQPPITLSPFSVHPIGYGLISLYVGYLAWQLFGPVSEAEAEVAKKQAEEAATAAAGGGEFLRTAASQEGATVQPSGLVYQSLVDGSGDSPTVEDQVKVHYTGKLFDGTVFDSSIERGEPLEFKLGQVIKGWQEGLTLMKPGGKAVLTIPSELAYGPMGSGTIPGSSVLQFEVELLEIKKKNSMFGGLF